MHKHFEYSSVLLSSCSLLYLSSTMSSCPVLCSALLIYSQISPSYFSHHKTCYVSLHPVHPFPTLLFSIHRICSHVSFIHLYFLLTSHLFPFVLLWPFFPCFYFILSWSFISGPWSCPIQFYSMLLLLLMLSYNDHILFLVLSYSILFLLISYVYSILFICFSSVL